MFAPLYAGITPEQYDIQVGAPAPIEILATKDVVDSVTTEQLKNNAAASVEPSYKSADFSGVDGVLNDLSARVRRAALGIQRLVGGEKRTRRP